MLSPCMYVQKWSSGFCALYVKNKLLFFCAPVDSNTAYAGWALISPDHSLTTSLQTLPVATFFVTSLSLLLYAFSPV